MRMNFMSRGQFQDKMRLWKARQEEERRERRAATLREKAEEAAREDQARKAADAALDQITFEPHGDEDPEPWGRRKV